MIILSQFSEPFLFAIINVKPLKGIVTKKLQKTYKKLDVTIDITLNK